MKDRVLPTRLLDINGLPDMARIEALPDCGMRIGPLARMSDVAADTGVRRRFPVIAEGLLFAAIRPAAQHGARKFPSRWRNYCNRAVLSRPPAQSAYVVTRARPLVRSTAMSGD